YFPAENPKYSMIVVIQNPRNGYYGATIAGPVFRELADMVYANDMDMHSSFDQLQLAVKDKKTKGNSPNESAGFRFASNQTAGSLPVKRDAVPLENIQHGVVPDVKGMGLQ